MVLTSLDRIHDVVTAVNTARCEREKDMCMEYERSSKWLSEVSMVRHDFDQVTKSENITVKINGLLLLFRFTYRRARKR